MRIVASACADALLQIIEQDEENSDDPTIFDYMEGLQPQIQIIKPQHSHFSLFFANPQPLLPSPAPAEIAIFKTIKSLLTEEQKAENVLNDLENIDQDGAARLPRCAAACCAAYVAAYAVAYACYRRPLDRQGRNCRVLREKSGCSLCAGRGIC